MKRFLEKLLNVILIVLISLLGLVLVSGIIQRLNTRHPYTGLFGTGYAVVASGSMEPNLHVNDLIVYHRQSAASYEVGDIIVYIRAEGSGEILITHRIIEIYPSGVITKGDANPVQDPAEVPYSAIVGKVLFRVPVMGTITSFLRNPVGIGIAALVVGLLFLLRYLSGHHHKEENHYYKEENARSREE